MANRPILPPVWLVGFSGHRPHPDEPGRSKAALEACRPLVEEALLAFRERAHAQEGEVHLYASLAEGSDCLAVEVALAMGLPIHIVLPMSLERFAEDFAAGSAEQERMERLLEEVRATPGGTVRVAGGSQVRPECYYDAGVQVIEAADALLVIDNGKEALGRGGTADIIDEAEAMALPLWVIDPVTTTRREVRRLEFFAHAEEPGLVRLQGLQAIMALERHEQEAHISMPKVFVRLDEVANQTAGTFRRATVWSLVFSGAAALLAALIVIYRELMNQHWGPAWTAGFTGLELILVLMAFLLARWMWWRHVRERWILARTAAELLRSYEATVGLVDPTQPLVERHRPEWRRLALSAMLRAAREHEYSEDETEALRDAYVRKRLAGQRDYFASHLARAERQSRRAQRCARVATALAVPFVFASFIVKLIDAGRAEGDWYFDAGPTLTMTTQFLPIALPLIASIALGLQHALDAGRRVHRYREMLAHLNAAEVRLAQLKTPATIARAILRVEENLMDEQLEWQIAAQAGR